MPSLIPEDIIEKIRDEIVIEEAIGHFVPLQRKGTTFWGLCPFHREKTPSFHVHPERRIFYCFGCGRGGSVFRFLMEREGMSFREAVQWCASRIGLDLERFLQEDPAATDARDRLLAATGWAASWFQRQLRAPTGAKAREYARARGLRPETLESFGLGFAPEGGQLMVDAARADGLSLEALLQVSLLRRSEGRAPFAYFRSRLIFPVRGVAQKIYGFGGRTLGPNEPKYLNSPETSLFQKRKVLYALPEARADVIRGRTAILVEGYLDALALHQSGWSQAVATCGTAFTPDQARLIGRYAERVLLLFDGDAAGAKAAFRAADVALESGLDVKVARMPAGKDPADLIREGEVEALRDVIEEAPGLVQRMHQEVETRGSQREMKERALRHLRDMLPKIPDPIRAELLVQEAADVFSVPESLLRPRRRDQGEPLAEPPPKEEGSRAELERNLLALAMTGRKARHLLVATLAPREFSHERTRSVFEALRQVDESVDTVREGTLTDLTEEEESLVARLLLEMPDPDLDATAELSANLERLAQVQRRDQAKIHRRDLDETYRSGGDWQSRLSRDRSPSSEQGGPTSTSQKPAGDA